MQRQGDMGTPGRRDSGALGQRDVKRTALKEVGHNDSRMY